MDDKIVLEVESTAVVLFGVGKSAHVVELADAVGIIDGSMVVGLGQGFDEQEESDDDPSEVKPVGDPDHTVVVTGALIDAGVVVQDETENEITST